MGATSEADLKGLFAASWFHHLDIVQPRVHAEMTLQGQTLYILLL